MPPLATYTASGQIRSGPVAPGVDASELDAGARALQGLGGQIAKAGQTVGELLERRQQEKDNRWVGDSQSALDRELIEFQQANSHHEDFGERYLAFADERKAEFEKNAPSGKAAEMFRGKVQPVINRDYERSLVKGEHNRLTNYDLGEDQNNIDRASLFRYSHSVNPDVAKQDLRRTTMEAVARNNAVFGLTMPKTAAIMSNKTEVSAVQTALDVDPEFAREILDSAKFINPQQHETLDGQIDRAEKSIAKGEHNRLLNYELGEDQNNIDRANLFRYSHSVNPDVAKQDLRRTTMEAVARNNAVFGLTMPKAAAIMSNKTEVSAVQTALDVDPEFAREILDSAKFINSQQYETLDGQIDRAEKSIAAKGAWKVAMAYQSAMDVAKVQGTPAPKVPDLDMVKAIYGEDQGEQVHAKLQAEADEQNATAEFTKKYRGISANFAQFNLQQETAALKPEDGAGARAVAGKQAWVNQLRVIQTKNPTAWLSANQEDVTLAKGNAERAFALAASTPDGPQKTMDMHFAMQEQGYYIDLLKHRQGPAPAGVPIDEAAKYLDLEETHIISKDHATRLALQMRDAGPEERLKIAQSLRQQYGRHAEDLFSDVAKMPDEADRLPASVVQGLAISNPRWAAAYMQAQVKFKSLGSLDPEQMSKYEKLVVSDPEFLLMKKGWLGEYSQRSQMMDSSKDGLARYAVMLASEGGKDGTPLNPADAVKMALQHVVTSEMAFVSVNGRVVPMARKIGDKTLTEDDAKDMGRGMEILLRQLPPQEIARTYGENKRFPIAPIGQDEQEFVMRKLWTNGFFVTDKDGTTATLYFNGDDGAFQLRDLSNRPFKIAYDRLKEELPKYTFDVPDVNFIDGPSMGTPMKKVVTSPGQMETGLGKSETRGSREINLNPFAGPMGPTRGGTYKAADKDTPLGPARGDYFQQRGAPSSVPIDVRWNWPTKSPVYAPVR